MIEEISSEDDEDFSKNYEDMAFIVDAASTMSPKMADDLWIGDTGASSHMKTSLSGMFDLKVGVGSVKLGNGKCVKVKNIGKFRGNVIQQDGSINEIILEDVHYIPDMYCNLFSLTKAMADG